MRQIGHTVLRNYSLARHGGHWYLGLCVALLVAGVSPSGAAAVVDESSPQTARDYYNQGTRRFREGKLREAESSLQTAVASNEEKVQTPALYNLAHVRFKQGVEALKDAPDARTAKARGDAACDLAGGAIQAADEALAGNDVAAITRAYMQGRGARKELKAAIEAVKKAMEAHGAVLSRWQRASGDFKSAYELRPKLDDAKTNGEVVDRCIAQLVDKQEMMMMAMKCMGGKRNDLKERMKQLKKKMPDGQQDPGGDKEEDEDDDEDQDKPPKEPQHGQKEQENKEGKEMALTYEEAMRLLQSLKLDANRKLPMGDKESANPKARKGKEW